MWITESLIAFSNDRYDERDLIVFPSARGSNSDLGVSLVHVRDGIYAAGVDDDPAKGGAIVGRPHGTAS